MKVKTFIATGFGGLTALLAIVAMAGAVALISADERFTRYQDLADDSILAARIESEMLLARMAVKQFIQTKDTESVTVFDRHLNHLLLELETADTDIQNPQRREHIALINIQLGTYQTGFARVVELMAQRDDIVFEHMNPNGLLARRTLTELMQSAYQDQDVEAAYRAGEVQEALLLARLYGAKFLTENRSEDLQRALSELRDNVQKRSKQLDQALQNPLRRELLARFQDAVSEYDHALIAIGKVITERNEIIKDQLDTVGPIVTHAALEVRDSIAEEQAELGAFVAQNNRMALTLITVLSLTALVLSGGASLYIGNHVVRPLGGEPNEMAALANDLAQGQLTAVNDGESSTGLRASMDAMAINLRSLVQSVNEASETVYIGASQIAAANQELSSRTEEQASSLQEIAVSIDQITATVQATSENAHMARESVEEATKLATAGKDIAEATHSAMADISKSSEEIKIIIKVIDEIAFQTNLLALNSAVEAARAGEQGRGFAVVANEVRSLAERTAVSARDISSLITNSGERINEGQRLVDESGESLTHIVESVSKAAVMVNAIATASQEQRSGMEQVNDAMSQMDSVTQSNASMVEEAESAAQSLEASADILRERMAFFSL